MTRLTNEIRDSIIRKALNEKFDPLYLKLKKEEHDVAMFCYNSVFDKKIISAAKKLPKAWLRQDACLRFNAGGYNLVLRLINTSVPVPYSTDCSRLENLSGDALEKARAHANKEKDLNDEKNKTYQALRSVLYSVTTVKKLKTVWQEGSKFYSMYDEESPKSKGGLPAVQIAEINAMLGLKPAKQKEAA
jgi:hypothetical protein